MRTREDWVRIISQIVMSAKARHDDGLPPIIAVDADQTLFFEPFPMVGKPNIELIEALKELQAQGYKIILWTCRREDSLARAVTYLVYEHHMRFDAINNSIPEAIELYDHDPRKVHADLYIDDKALSMNSMW